MWIEPYPDAALGSEPGTAPGSRYEQREGVEFVRGYVDAWERADVEAVVAMLTDDATIAMPPISTWYSGRDAVAGFLRGWPLSGEPRWRIVAAGANGQPAFGHYLWDGATRRFMPHSINLLTLRSGRISDLTAFLTPEAFSRFGLPDRM